MYKNYIVGVESDMYLCVFGNFTMPASAQDICHNNTFVVVANLPRDIYMELATTEDAIRIYYELARAGLIAHDPRLRIAESADFEAFHNQFDGELTRFVVDDLKKIDAQYLSISKLVR